MASDSREEPEVAVKPVHAVDLGPFTHEREAALCRQVMGDRAHGLDGILSAAS